MPFAQQPGRSSPTRDGAVPQLRTNDRDGVTLGELDRMLNDFRVEQKHGPLSATTVHFHFLYGSLTEM
jgi:hypothetical protein